MKSLSLYALLCCLCSLPLMAMDTVDMGVRRAVDINPDPQIFETTLVAAPHVVQFADGEVVTAFAYNGQIPGPEIRVKRGDRLIVHLQNHLPEGFPTTIHWHGVELNNASDGTTVTQNAVEPGEAFTYDFIVPRAGIFWYHPHVRSGHEVNAGLYAPLIVTQPEEAELTDQGVLPKRDVTLVLSDIAVAEGAPKDIATTPMLETMNGTEGERLLVNGRELPTLNAAVGQGIRLRLINASITRYFRLSLPDMIYRIGGEGGLLAHVVVEGGPIHATRMPMTGDHGEHGGMDMGGAHGEHGGMDMGGDTGMGMGGAHGEHGGMDMGGDTGMGMGSAHGEHGGMDMGGGTGGDMIMIDQGYAKGELLLAPSQRADVVIVPQGHPGDNVTVKWLDFSRGRHQMMMNEMGMMMMDEAEDDGTRPSIDLFNFNLQPMCMHDMTPGDMHPYMIMEGMPLVEMPHRLVADRTDSQIKLQSNMMAMMNGMPKNTWFQIDDFSGVPGRENYRMAHVGETIEWEVHNHTDMHHPFHMHGFSFQPNRFVRMHHDMGIMDMWSVNPHNEFVDVVDIPPHTSLFYTFQVGERPEYGADVGTTAGMGALGDWVFHCHIFQHGTNGMMSFLRVMEGNHPQ